MTKIKYKKLIILKNNRLMKPKLNICVFLNILKYYFQKNILKDFKIFNANSKVFLFSKKKNQIILPFYIQNKIVKI